MNTAKIKIDGQWITVTDATTTVHGKTRIEFIPHRSGVAFVAWNHGAPDNFYGNRPWEPEPLFWDALEIDCPGLRPQLAELMMARQVGPGRWVITDESKFKHHHKRALPLTPRPGLVEPPQPVYVPSLIHHMVDGGERLYVNLVPENDHLEMGVVPTTDELGKARAVANMDATFEVNPAIRRLLNLYRVTADSFNKNAKVRDWGWWLVPENFVYQWRSQNIEDVRGWYPAGDLRSPSDGSSNCHYDHDANALINYLLTGDHTSLFLGLTLVRTKVAYGLIDTALDRSQVNLKGYFKGEKGGSRRGEGVGAPSTKQWDLGLCLACCLRPDDPMIQRGMVVRGECLLNQDFGSVWKRAGGGRAIGHYLMNLLDHFRATGDAAFSAKAQAFIDYVFALNGTLDYFENTLRPGYNACWEEALAHASIYNWMAMGIGNAHKPQLDKMLDWLYLNGSEIVAPGHRRVAFEVQVSTGIKTWDPGGRAGAGWTNGSFWAKLPPRRERDEAVAYTLSKVPDPVSVVWGSMGPGWEKQVGQLANMVR